MDWSSIVVEPVKAMLVRAATFLPTLIGILVILVVGWIIAAVLKNVVVKLLKMIQFDGASEKSGLADVLRKGGIKNTLSELIGGLIYWVIMLLVFMTALNALGMTVVASLLDKVILYIPNVIAAIFIITLGIFFASIIGSIVMTASMNAGIKQSKLLSQVTQTVIVIFATIMTLEQLNIATTILNTSITILLGAVGLAVAIAVGLGSKDIAGKLMQELLDNLKRK
jgi:Conserved TM helix